MSLQLIVNELTVIVNESRRTSVIGYVPIQCVQQLYRHPKIKQKLTLMKFFEETVSTTKFSMLKNLRTVKIVQKSRVFI